MVGIILVTKPPCLFPSAVAVEPIHDDDDDDKSLVTAILTDYLNREFDIFQLVQLPAAPVAAAAWPLYSVGAVLGLATAMCTAAYCCLTSKLDTAVDTSVQLLYIGVFCLPLAPVALLAGGNATNRFFDGGVADIPLQDWMGLLGVSVTGLLAFYLELKALTMVPPSVFATLETSQIVVAFAAQCVMNHALPSLVDVAGSGLVFASSVAIILEPQLTSRVKCTRRGPQ